jgi:protein-S-isoprenylcysteine O-methyltransferase Ste14
MIVYAALLIWSALALITAKKENRLAKKGPYALFRHPMYVGIVLLVNPGLAILLRSWSLLEACLVLYFIWKRFAKKEEKGLIEIFGDEYKEYAQKTGCLFPKTC